MMLVSTLKALLSQALRRSKPRTKTSITCFTPDNRTAVKVTYE